MTKRKFIFVGKSKSKSIFFGKAFSDMISRFDRSTHYVSKGGTDTAGSWQETFAFGRLNQPKAEIEISSWRLLPFYLFMTVVVFFLLTRLAQLQLIEGKNFLNASEGNRSLIRVVHAPRGVIYDRNKQMLASNIPGFRVALNILSLSKEKEATTIKKIAPILQMSESEITEKITSSNSESVTLKNEVDRDTALKIEAIEDELPGVEVEVTSIRQYAFGSLLAHILGYTGEVSKDELSADTTLHYKAGDKVGRGGVEEFYEKVLRGTNGQELLKVDANGKKGGILASIPPIAGEDVVLSIDLGLQRVMEEALKEELTKAHSAAGTAVVQNPKTGEILGMVSLPSYDDNLFAKGISRDDYENLMNDKKRPMINRAVSSAYPPGSTFKIITAAAGLESGKISKETKIEDTGEFFLGSFRFTNWYFTQNGKKEGMINVVKALARSNDIFFYQVGMRVGEILLEKFSHLFGLGDKLGIDIPGEVTGLVPNEEWKKKITGEPWYPGNTVNMSIGQGDLMTTPLQINSMTTAIANNGKLLKPTVIRKDRPEVVRENIITQSSLETIQEGLSGVTKSGGTAWPFFDFKVPVAGKTGTAETGKDSNPHAWFTGYAPLGNPEIVVTVLVEKGGEGSNVAAPVAKKIMEYYFHVK